MSAITTRAFLSAMVLLGRPKTQTKVMGDVDEGMRWLASSLRRGTVGWTVEGLAATHDEMVHLAQTEAPRV